MQPIREYLEAEITPRLLLSIGVLLMLLIYLLTRTLWQNIDRLETNIVDQRSLISQMTQLRSSQQLDGEALRLNTLLGQTSTQMLTEETDGLNAALLQQKVRDTMSTCGLSDLTLTPAPISDPPTNSVRKHILDIRARGADEHLASCLYALSTSDIYIRILSMRWAKGGFAFLTLSAYSPGVE